MSPTLPAHIVLSGGVQLGVIRFYISKLKQNRPYISESYTESYYKELHRVKPWFQNAPHIPRTHNTVQIYAGQGH